MIRKINSIKIIMLILNYDMFRCNKIVIYIDTILLKKRSIFVKFFWQLKRNLFEQKVNENEKFDFFYKNQIEKYFVRFSKFFYDQLSYFDYYAQYNLIKSIIDFEREIINNVKNVVKKKQIWFFFWKFFFISIDKFKTF